jgi:hypothetical protein
VVVSATGEGAPAGEVRLELLLGRKVWDAAGTCVGRIEEVCAELDGADYVVREYPVGSLAGWERLFGGRLARSLLRTVSGGRVWRGYRVPWSDLDLADPARPRVRRLRSALEPLPPPG